MPEDNLAVKFEPFGPQPAVMEQLSRELVAHHSIQEYLRNTRHRLLYVELVDLDPEEKKDQEAQPPSQFLATFYDYTNNRTIRALGSLADRRNLELSEFGDQPAPSDEEFAEAVKILTEHSELGPPLREQRLRPYAPMPPLASFEQPDGRFERSIAVGLLPATRGARHEIVAVNMIRQTVIRFPNHAPENSAAQDTICGPPDAGQPTVARGTAGSAWVTVTQGNTVLWKFLVVRPAASSGTNGSGVELRYVDYRGKRVLYRAHVPILNVKYSKGPCGPYRDWQWQEGMIQANGSDVAPGFRLCATPAQTILDTGSDVGNYLGVAIYVQEQEVVFVSEMQAGWYRYISEWRLRADGRIHPRFGFSAVQSSCVCTAHHHHVYWRLDFDIRTPGNNLVREFNNPPLFPPSNWHDKIYEIRRPRDPARNRKWRVENTVSGEAYEVIPNADDGVATASPDWPFPRGDVWILRYHGNEIDDGAVATGPPYEAGIDQWVNGELIKNQDIVIWYSGHVTHDITHEPPGVHGHIVGPELKPVKW